MRESILSFGKQFEYHPEIENSKRLKLAQQFIVVGMGGSHLAADLVKMWNPYRRFDIYSDYDLPKVPHELLRKSLIIASSYSGNTEETLTAFDDAVEEGYPLAAYSIGGELIKKAQDKKVPYIQMPDTGIEPRSSLGFGVIALLSLIQDHETLAEVHALAATFRPEAHEAGGEEFARALQGKIPVIYSSARNRAIAYNWKIKFNENTKIPAFYNVFPELNHNEMTGYDMMSTTQSLSKDQCFIFITDENDDPRVQKRMKITQQMYEDRGLQVEREVLSGLNQYDKTFTSIIRADWVALYLAEHYGTDPKAIPMVDELKRLMK